MEGQDRGQRWPYSWLCEAAVWWQEGLVQTQAWLLLQTWIDLLSQRSPPPPPSLPPSCYPSTPPASACCELHYNSFLCWQALYEKSIVIARRCHLVRWKWGEKRVIWLWKEFWEEIRKGKSHNWGFKGTEEIFRIKTETSAVPQATFGLQLTPSSSKRRRGKEQWYGRLIFLSRHLLFSQSSPRTFLLSIPFLFHSYSPSPASSTQESPGFRSQFKMTSVREWD